MAPGNWGAAVAARFGYTVRFLPVGPDDQTVGPPTQSGIREACVRMIEELRKYVGKREKVRITRSRPSESRLNGYLIEASDELLLMHCFDDFEPDGYTIIRVADVTGLRRCPYEQWWDHMLEQEGLLGALDHPPNIDLQDMRSAMESVGTQYGQMIIECEDEDEDIEDFYLGELVSTNYDTAYLLDYDSLGFWAKEPKDILMDEITMVQFDTPYIRIFSKYTRQGTPPEFPERDRDE